MSDFSTVLVILTVFETVPLPKFKLNIAWNENPQLAVGWGVELSYFGAGRPAPARRTDFSQQVLIQRPFLSES